MARLASVLVAHRGAPVGSSASSPTGLRRAGVRAELRTSVLAVWMPSGSLIPLEGREPRGRKSAFRWGPALSTRTMPLLHDGCALWAYSRRPHAALASVHLAHPLDIQYRRRCDASSRACAPTALMPPYLKPASSYSRAHRLPTTGRSPFAGGARGLVCRAARSALGIFRASTQTVARIEPPPFASQAVCMSCLGEDRDAPSRCERARGYRCYDARGRRRPNARARRTPRVRRLRRRHGDAVAPAVQQHARYATSATSGAAFAAVEAHFAATDRCRLPRQAPA
jgi:hypothetical protein